MAETMAANGSEKVMLRDTSARSGRGLGASRRRSGSIPDLLTCVWRGKRIATAVGLLASCGLFGSDGLWASNTPAVHPLTVQRSTRAIPHRFTVHPNGATVAANQTQRFEVTDAEGKSVAVHWNVSGIGCSGLACGSIDDQGVYRTPSSLPQQREIILEGVLVSDPNYSVLAQIRLEDAGTVIANPASAEVATARTKEIPAPVVGRQSVAGRAELPALPDVIAAAPIVVRQKVASSSALPALPDAIAAAPTIARQNVASSVALPALPTPIAAAPVIQKQNSGSRVSLPLPDAVAAAPVIRREKVASSIELLGLPVPVGAAPVIVRQKVASNKELPALPLPVSAAPVVEKQPPVISAALLPLSSAAAAPAVGIQNLAVRGALPPMADLALAAPQGSALSTQHAPVVSYRDGQLTIDADNSTLAAVLKMVAEKTGSVIDIPPGTGLERIVQHSGPGRAEDVLAHLLNGSPFDFIIVGSPQRPHDPAEVLLFLHGADAPVEQAAQAKTFDSPLLYTPPERAPLGPLFAKPVIPPQTQPLTPEVREQMMKDYARQLREHPQQ